jgi:hypothetical protein
LLAMVSRVMSPTVTKEIISDIERHIKLFLSAFDTFDKQLRKSRSTPTWITSHNFICLMNLPMVLREFGPLCNLWEGGGQGEKVLRLLKPNWNGYRLNWQLHIMNKMLQNMAITRIKSKLHPKEEALLEGYDSDGENESFSDLQKKMCGSCYIYSNISEVVLAFYNHRPISALRLLTGNFVCMLQNGKQCTLTPNKFIKTLIGLSYFDWNISDNESILIQHHKDIQNYCLLLPKINKHGLPTWEMAPIYTVIDSEWRQLDIGKKYMQKPKIQNASYD